MGKIFIGNIRGPKGNKGDRGSNWKEGTAITGTSTTDTAFPNSGITDAMVDDQYLNTDTGNLYTCTVAGDPNTAMWVYTGNIKGPKGDVEDGVIDFSESDDRENIVSGDTVSTVFGKIKKWFSDLGAAAFMNVVNGVTQSQAGQAVLDAAVGKYLEEKKLDITKIIANRNITEPGFVMDGKTLVDWLNELNGNMSSGRSYIYDGSVKDLEPGMYFCTPGVSDLPLNDYCFVDIVSLTLGNIDRIIKAYDIIRCRLYTLFRINGNWASSWSVEILKSDLDYVDCNVVTIKDTTVTIPNSPSSSFYIPIIFGHSVADLVREFVFWNGSNWIIRSDYGQTVMIRFYKYPI